MTTPLPPNDPPGTDDRLPGEAELAALYRQLPQREPSPALDAAVLRAAAQALPAAEGRLHAERRQGPRESGDWVHLKRMAAVSACEFQSLDDGPRMDAARRRRRVPHWLVALGSAASLVLVAGLAWYMRTTPTSPPMSAEPAAQPQLTTAAAMQTTGRAEARLAAAPEAVASQAKRRASAKVFATPPPAADVAAAPPPANMAAPARRAAPVSGNALEAKSRAIATPPALPAAAPALQEMSATPLAAPPPPAPPVPVAAAQDAVNGAAAFADTPAQQLARIEQLFAQGHVEEARKQLRAFHQAHPTWPLPAELKAQLPEP